jgi:hypothetical protein
MVGVEAEEARASRLCRLEATIRIDRLSRYGLGCRGDQARSLPPFTGAT